MEQLTAVYKQMAFNLLTAAATYLLFAFVTQFVIRLLEKEKPGYWNAYIVSYTGYLGAFFSGFGIGFALGGKAKETGTIIIASGLSGFFVSALIMYLFIRLPSGKRLNYWKCCSVCLAHTVSGGLFAALFSVVTAIIT